MEWDKFKDKFHESWHPKIQKWVESEDCDKLYEFLKKESKRGVGIGPLSSNTYRAFKETSLNDINCVILSYCPYHTFIQGVSVADGLAFSCSVTNKLQLSLETFYNGLEQDLYNGLNLTYKKSPDLLYLAKQGILLLNSSLTVAKDKAGSHQEKWQGFTKFILEECFAYTGIPIIFIGKDAQFYERYTTPLTHGHTFNIEHPSFAARNQQDWNTKGSFKAVTTIVKQNNGINLRWLCTQEEIEEILNKDNCPF